MKIGTTLVGLENILKDEAKGKIIIPGRVLFKNNKKLRSCLLTYDYIKHFKFKNENEIYEKIPKIKFKGTFRIDCSRQGKHIFNSQEIRQKIGEIFYNQGNKVDLNNPDNIFYADIIDNYCFFGKNPQNLAKRDYRVRSSKDSLNACLAYSLLKIAKFSKNKILLDCFCGDGIILIEAGLIGGKNLYGFNNDIKNASINAKVANVKINLYKEDLNWLDTFFKKNSVDIIATKIIFESKTKSINFVDKIIREFFHHADHILKNKGIIVLLTPKIELIEKYSKYYNFNLKKELIVEHGNLNYFILSLKRFK